jgi:hypothetical protein
MIQLMYVSTSTVAFNDESLRALLAGARTANVAVEVTGMLLHQDGSFLQVLEGKPVVIDPLFAKIGRDRRHGGVVMLARNDITVRNFPDWSMGFTDVRGSAAALVGYRQLGELKDLLGDTSAIRRVVQSFRDGRWHHRAA